MAEISRFCAASQNLESGSADFCHFWLHAAQCTRAAQSADWYPRACQPDYRPWTDVDADYSPFSTITRSPFRTSGRSGYLIVTDHALVLSCLTPVTTPGAVCSRCHFCRQLLPGIRQNRPLPVIDAPQLSHVAAMLFLRQRLIVINGLE